MKIYLDNNATTRPADEVIAAMLTCLREKFGNPSSAHSFGEAALAVVNGARETAAEFLSCPPTRITFTGGGSEANNLAIMSAVAAHPEKRHIISSPVEHDSVLNPLAHLAARGYEVEMLSVDRQGGIDPEKLLKKIRPDTCLVSLMGANNETGVIWPVKEIGRICGERGALYHCDAVQMAGKIELRSDFCDYLVIAAHKLHGPKGVGLLCSGRRAPLTPMIHGGSQEHGRRAGTENVPAIAGMAAALTLAMNKRANDGIKGLRKRIEQKIKKEIPGVLIVAEARPRLPNTVNACFRHCSGAGIAQDLDSRGIAVSTRSACHSGDIDPSHVLAAMGIPEEYLHGSIRISLSRYNTEEEIDLFLKILKEITTRAAKNFIA